jgi:phosphoglycerate dehydrogenase-like enzyme
MKISLLRKNKSRQNRVLSWDCYSNRFKIDKTLLDKASNLQFIARVGAGLESIDCDYAVSKKITLIAAQKEIECAAGAL